MPLTDMGGPSDMGGADDFVLVLVDDPVRIPSFQDDVGMAQVDTDYVTVNADDSIDPATQYTPTAPTSAKHHEFILQMEKFQPILLNEFPKQIKQVALMAPMPTTDQALKDDVNGSSSASHPHKVLIKNATLLFECFFHFKAVYPKIGRDFMLYVVGKACEVNAEDAISLQRRVARTLGTLAGSRKVFMMLNQDLSTPDAEDSDVRELARLAASYVYFTPEEPQRVEKTWYNDRAVNTLWRQWQEILKKKGLRVNAAKSETASSLITGAGAERSNLFSLTVQAIDSLVDDMNLLEISRFSSALTQSEKQLLEGAMMSAKRWKRKVKQLRRQ